MFFKITGFLGGKRAVKSLGAFCLLLFGICSLIFAFSTTQLQPSWIIWVFWGGTALGFVLLIGGSFAEDVKVKE